MKRRVPARVQVGRFLRMVLPAVAILVAAVVALLGIIAYRIARPGPVADPASPVHFLLPVADVQWPSREGAEVSGWWIPGVPGAPAVILAPGYGMTRGDALSLATLLREQAGYNLLVFEARGSSRERGPSTLGLGETAEMLGAVDFVLTRPEVAHDRIGIWGVDVTARAALAAARERAGVRAVAADSVFSTVSDFVAVRVTEETGSDNVLLEVGCRLVFRLLHFMVSLGEGIPPEALSDRAILLIQGDNRKALARHTAALYERIQPQKELVRLPVSRTHLMSGQELRDYDAVVVRFFILNLPRVTQP